MICRKSFSHKVPKEGLEPSRYCYHWILNLGPAYTGRQN